MTPIETLTARDTYRETLTELRYQRRIDRAYYDGQMSLDEKHARQRESRVFVQAMARRHREAVVNAIATFAPISS